MGYRQERHLDVIPQNCWRIQNPGTFGAGSARRPHFKWEKSETEEVEDSNYNS